MSSPELDLAGLEAVLAAEIDGKHRSSLIAEIGQAIDALKTEEEAPAEECQSLLQSQFALP